MRKRWKWVGVAGMCAVVLFVVIFVLDQRREFAQRSQSATNQKQILLGSGKFDLVYFPKGTVNNVALEPDKRLSWQADLLPYSEGVRINAMLHRDKAWDDPANREAASMSVRTYLNPGVVQQRSGGLALTHYAGIAGLGVDGPTLSANNPRAGCFAYNRATRLSEIIDGDSNTAMISELSSDYGPWIAGGRPTIRSLTKPPMKRPANRRERFRGHRFVRGEARGAGRRPQLRSSGCGA